MKKKIIKKIRKLKDSLIIVILLNSFIKINKTLSNLCKILIRIQNKKSQNKIKIYKILISVINQVKCKMNLLL
jgi:hypothetical protein